MSVQEPEAGRQWPYEARDENGELIAAIELGGDEDALRWSRILAQETGRSVTLYKSGVEIGPKPL